MHQIKDWSKSGDKGAFLQGVPALKNAIDLTREHGNAAIVHVNDTVGQRIEEGHQEENKDEEEDGHEEGETEGEDTDTPRDISNLFENGQLAK